MIRRYVFENSQISIWSEAREKEILLPVQHSNPAVGVVGKENIVLAVDKTGTDSSYITEILPLGETGVILAYAGSFRDAPFLVKRVQIEIEDSGYPNQYNFPISPVNVACKVANVHRQFDFCIHKAYSLLTLIVGFEPSTLSHELWVSYPNGMVRKCRAHAIGRDFDLRNKFLRNNYNYQETSGQTAVKLAIRALLEVGESGEKKIGVTLITREHGLKTLEQDEIDAIISEIEAEKGASEKFAIIDEIEEEREAIIGDIEAEKAAFEKEAIITEIKEEKAASEKSPSKKERKKTNKSAVKKKKRKAKKAAEPLDVIIVADHAEMDAEHVEKAHAEGPAKKTPPDEPLDVIVADHAEMDAEHVEMAHAEGPKVDEIEAENPTRRWIPKILSCLLPT